MDFDPQKYKSISARLDEHERIIAFLTRDVLVALGEQNIPVEDTIRALDRHLSGGFKRILGENADTINGIIGFLGNTIESIQRFTEGQIDQTDAFVSAAIPRNANLPPPPQPAPQPVAPPPRPPLFVEVRESLEQMPVQVDQPPPGAPAGQGMINIWAPLPGLPQVGCICRPADEVPDPARWRIASGPHPMESCLVEAARACPLQPVTEPPPPAPQPSPPAPQPPPPLPQPEPPPPAPPPETGKEGACPHPFGNFEWMDVRNLDIEAVIASAENPQSRGFVEGIISSNVGAGFPFNLNFRLVSGMSRILRAGNIEPAREGMRRLFSLPPHMTYHNND